MKPHRILTLSVFAVVASLLLASCGSTSTSFSKRKHLGPFHAHVKKAKVEKPNTYHTPLPEPVATTTAPVEQETATTTTEVADASVPATPAPQPKVKEAPTAKAAAKPRSTAKPAKQTDRETAKEAMQWLRNHASATAAAPVTESRAPATPAEPAQPMADIVLIIIAILLPWLAVLLYEGSITINFWISLILWFLGWLPGVIFALLLIGGYI